MKKPHTFALIALGLLSLTAGLGLAQDSMKDSMKDSMQDPAMKTEMKDSMKDMHMHEGYVAYTLKAFNAARDKKRVLFFAASWCPSCQGADKDLKSKAQTIPENVVVFKVDYDKEKALKTKYNITYQHTFVQVDASGKALKTWSGGGLKEILAALQR